MDQLRQDIECLLYVLLDEAHHTCAEILLENIDVGEAQAQTLHIVEALDCEGPPR